MPLSALNTEKELAVTYQSLLVAEITFKDGSVLRVSTHPLNTAQGGAQYGGNDYYQRIVESDIAALEAQSPQGIHLLSAVSLNLADADREMWTQWEAASGKGFKGATMVLRQIMWNPGTSDFSSDSRRVFRGICDPAQVDGSRLRVSANSRSLTKSVVPQVVVQGRCPWVFPTNLTERTAAFSDPSSPFYRCGYSPENGRGTAGFTSCDYTKSACAARGLLVYSGSKITSGPFAGVTWEPPKSYRSRSYTSGQQVEGQNAGPSYGVRYPLVYGTAWIKPEIMNSVGDGNSTRGEAVVGVGYLGDGVQRVIVNDYEIPRNYGSGVDPLFRWQYVTQGGRDGAPNQDLGFDGNGDPYGSLPTVEIVVLRRVTENLKSADVRVLTRGEDLRVWFDSVSFTSGYTENPAWIVMDLLCKGNYSYDLLNIDSFIAAAQIHDATVSYTDQYGVSTSRSRHTCSVYLREKKDIDSVVQGVLNGAGAYIIENGQSGKLEYYIEGTLAEEQPSAVAGSNYVTAVASKNRAGAATNGYVAYKFDENNIIGMVNVSKASILDNPNRTGFRFFNKDNGYAEDTLFQTDSEDVGRVGQQTEGSLNILGPNTFDQAKKIQAFHTAKRLRGNSAGDTRGTDFYTFTASVGASHLRKNHLVLLSWTQLGLGLSNRVCRVVKIQPDKNYEKVRLTVAFHNDDWYLDSFGQITPDRIVDQGRFRPNRVPLNWKPGRAVPQSGDPLHATTQGFAKVVAHYTDGVDGTAIPRLEVIGRQPVNSISSDVPAPFGPLQGSSSSTGGTISGNQLLYLGFIAKIGGTRSGMSSPLTEIQVASGTNTNTVTAANLRWPTGADGYEVYAGPDPLNMTLQASGGSPPSSVTLTAITGDAAGAPDVVAEKIKVTARPISVDGVYTATITAKPASNQLQVAGTPWTTNQWVGRDAAVYNAGPDGTEIKLLNFAISSNTNNTLTLGSTATNVVVGDTLSIRCKATATSASTITDSSLSLGSSAEVGNQVFIDAGLGAGQFRTIASHTSTAITVDSDWDTTPDTTSRFVIVKAVSTQAETAAIRNENPDADTSILLDIVNLAAGYLIEGYVLDSDGRSSMRPSYRVVYVTGDVGTITGAAAPDNVANTSDIFTGSLSVTWTGISESGARELRAFFQFTPPSPQGTFVGVRIFAVASSVGTIHVGDVDYFMTHPTAQSSNVILPDLTVGESVSIYLCSRSESIVNALDFNPGGTPYRTTTVPAPTTGSSGQEYAGLVTSAAASVSYEYAEDGQQLYRISGSFTEPTSAPYGGCRIVARPASGNDIEIADCPRGVNSFRTDGWTVNHSSEALDIYFVSYDRANSINSIATGVTPKVTVTVTRQNGTAGQEFAPLVTAFTVNVRYSFGEDGGQRYQFYGTVTPPSDARFKAYRVVARVGQVTGGLSISTGGTTATRTSGQIFSPDMVGKSIDIAGQIHTVATFVDSDHITITPSWAASTGTWSYTLSGGEDIAVAENPYDVTSFTTDEWPVNHASETFTIYVVSMDGAGRANSIVNGTTPSTSVSVVRISGSSGREYADLISNIVVDGGAGTAVTEESGVTSWIATGSVTEPSDPRYGGFRIIRLGNLSDVQKNIEICFVPRGYNGKYRTDFQPTQSGVTSMTLAFISVDTSGRSNLYVSGVTPEITISIPSQGNTLNLAKVLPGSLITSAFASTIRPVSLFSSNPALPDATNYPAHSYGRNTTTGEFLRVNSAGNAWVKAVDGGLDIVADSITSATIAAGAVSTSELFAGEILVGAGGGKPTRFRVNDSVGSMVGFIGDNGAGFVGAYFVNIRVGSNINSPFMYCDGSAFRLGANAISFANFYVDSTQALINNMPISTTTSGITTSINHEAYSSGRQGLTVSTNIGVSAVQITPGNITFVDNVSGATKVFLNAPNGSGASFALYNSSGQQNFRVTCNFSGTYPTIVLNNGITQKTGQTWSGTRTFALAGGGSYTMEVVAGLIVSA